MDNDQSHPTKLRNDRVQSAYSDRINARLQMAPNRGSTNHRPKSLNSPPSGKSEIRNRQPEVGLNRKWSIDCSALFNSNSSSTNQNRTWQKSGSTSSLDNILTYNHNIQNQNDFNFDDDFQQGTFSRIYKIFKGSVKFRETIKCCKSSQIHKISRFQTFTIWDGVLPLKNIIGAQSSTLVILETEKDPYAGSYSDSEIITLEEVGPGLSDADAAINGLSNQLQKGLVTDQTRSQQSKGTRFFNFHVLGSFGRRMSEEVLG